MNVCIKFEIEIPKQTRNHVIHRQRGKQTDRRAKVQNLFVITKPIGSHTVAKELYIKFNLLRKLIHNLEIKPLTSEW